MMTLTRPISSRPPLTTIARSVLLLLLAAIAPACAPLVTHYMVDCPNQGVPDSNFGPTSPNVLRVYGVDRQYRVPVGPPAASLLVWVIDPDQPDDAPPAPPKGTILVLHGYRNQMQWMLGKAHALSREGYRTVLVDLRGHGSSSGEYLTYGYREAADLSQVLDALQDRGELSGPVGVWGLSYGASTAIMLGARDERIRAVVAVAPFASMRQIVPVFVRTFAPISGISDEQLDEMIDQDAAMAGFDPSQADIAAAAAHLDAPLLLMHGEWDGLVPPENSEQIALAASHAGIPLRRIVIPYTNHVTIYFDITGQVGRESVAWFAQYLARPAGVGAPRAPRTAE